MLKEEIAEASNITEVKQAEESPAYQGEQQRRPAVRQQITENLRAILALLNANSSLDEVLTYLVAQARRLLGCQAAVIYSMQGEAGEVRIQAEQGLSDSFLANVKLPAQQRALRRAVALPQPLAVPNAISSTAGQKERTSEAQGTPGLSSLIAPYCASVCVPINIKNAVYGRISFYYTEPQQFSAEEMELITLFSDQATLGIENVLLREQVKQTAIVDERHRLARELHDALTQTLLAASLMAEALPRVWERDTAEGQRGLKELRVLLRGSITELRALLLKLRPTILAE
jgi:signal transduction histidine kinase